MEYLKQTFLFKGNGQRQFNQRNNNNNNNNRRPAGNSYSVNDNEIDTTGRGQAPRGQQSATGAGNGYSGPSAIGSNDPLVASGEGIHLCLHFLVSNITIRISFKAKYFQMSSSDTDCYKKIKILKKVFLLS